MINDLLQELLANAWESIETREVQRQLRLAQVQVPEVSDAYSIPHVKVKGPGIETLVMIFHPLFLHFSVRVCRQ